MGRATVKSHLEHVFAKLGVRSRAELAAQAVQQQPASCDDRGRCPWRGGVRRGSSMR